MEISPSYTNSYCKKNIFSLLYLMVSTLKLGSPPELRTGMTETGLVALFMDLLRLMGRAGLSPAWNTNH